MKSSNPFIIQISAILIDIRNGIDYKNEKWKSAVPPSETFDEIMITGKVYRHILVNVYGMLVKDKSINSIDSIDETEKQKIKDETKKILKGRLVDPGLLMELYKSVYTLGIISQQ